MKIIDLAERLRTELEGYTLSALRDALGSVGMAAVEREQRIPAIRHAITREGKVPLLARLFLLGHVLDEEEYEQALPSIPLDEAIDAGLISKNLKALIAIRPIPVPDRHGGGELLIASDLGPLQGSAPTYDHVMPVGGATKTLASMTTYEPGQSVLDLGTGCGYHAILAARAGACAVATDVSGRALRFTELNAALAGVSVETRLGSLYEPITERFDRIVSNPPFVVTPPGVREVIGTYEYRDAGGEGDSLLQSILTGIGDHLADDGVAWMLGNWLIDTDADSGELANVWADRVGEWIGDREAWVVLRDAIDPAQYAEMWLQDAGITGSAFAMAYSRWLKELHFGAIGFGYITLGGSDGAQRFEDYRGPIGDGFADYVWQNLHLAALPESELLDRRLVNTGLVEKRLHTPGQEDPWHISLLGHGREMAVSAELAGLVGVCDGELSVKQIIAALSTLLEVPLEEMTGQLLPGVRELVGAGMLADHG